MFFNSPIMSIQNRTYQGDEESLKLSAQKDLTWVLVRHYQSKFGQQVPGWAGFISSTGSEPTKLTSIDYYPVINHPITEYKTVQACLKHAEEATKEVGQEYTVTTFDLGVCMKAYPLIWNQPDKYRKHIIMVGTFHLVGAYLKMIGKKMAGSGLSDVLIETGLIGSGSIQCVMNGKHYDRAIHCHKIVLEALERLLLEQFLLQENSEHTFGDMTEAMQRTVDTFIQFPSKHMLTEFLNDQSIHELHLKMSMLRQEVRDGKLGKTLDVLHCSCVEDIVFVESS